MKNIVKKLEKQGEFIKAARLEKLVSVATKEMTYKGKPITEKEALDLVKKNVFAIQWIENPSEALKLEAVKQNGYAIKFIKNPSEEVQIEAVKQSGWVIQYIKNASVKVQLEAVKENVWAIQYIENPSEELKLKAVKQNGYAIQYIENPSEVVKLEAVKQDGDAIQHIENPSVELQMEAVKQNHKAIEFIKNPTEKVRKYAEKKSQIKDFNLEYEFNDNDLFLISRHLKKHGLDSISIRTLKKEFVITPVIQDLISKLNGKDLTLKSLIEFDKNLEQDIDHVDLKDLLKHSKLLKSVWNETSQRIFKNKNHVFLLGTPIKYVTEEKLQEYSTNTNHPSVHNYLTLIWIRYTKFKDYIWVDEIQSDLDKVADINTKNLYSLILKKFIQYHSSKGFKIFYYPTYNIKRKFYQADPPASIYKDLPKKFRFKLLDSVDFDTKSLMVKQKDLNEEKVWKLEAKLNRLQ